MKKKTLKSLSLKKSNIAAISGGLQDGQAQQAASLLACPTGTTILTIHTIDPWRCPTMSRNTKCVWCDTLG